MFHPNHPVAGYPTTLTPLPCGGPDALENQETIVIQIHTTFA